MKISVSKHEDISVSKHEDISPCSKALLGKFQNHWS